MPMPQMPSKPMQGPQPGGDPMSAMKQNMSIFNPVDATAMRESGEITQQTTIREFFASKGVDVDGPITQLVQFVQDQAQKAQPLNKMKAMAGQGPQSPMMAGQGQGQQMQAPPPDLGGMIKGMRG